MSNNVGGVVLAPGMENPEVAVNTLFGRLDAALTEEISVDLSSGNGTLTLAQLQSSILVRLVGATQARDVTLVACKRLLFFKNMAAQVVTLKLGTGSLAVPASGSVIARLDGSANGIEAISAGGGGSGGSGLPNGGTIGQGIRKKSSTNGDAEWTSDLEWVGRLIKDVTNGDPVVTTEDLAGIKTLIFIGTPSAARAMTFPKSKRILMVRNRTTQNIVLTQGSNVITVRALTSELLSVTGEDNGLFAGSAFMPFGGTTGQLLAKRSDAEGDAQWVNPPSGGGSGGIPDAPTDGKSYVRKSAAWSELSTGPVTQKLVTSEVVAGNSGIALTLQGGETRYFVHNSMQGFPSQCYIGAGKKGKFKNLVVITQGAPGDGQSYKFTLQNLFTNTTLTCTISGSGSNRASDLVNTASFEANDRWCIKVEASAGAAATTGILFGMEYETEQDITIPSVAVIGGGGGGSIVPVKPPVLSQFTVNGGKGFTSAEANAGLASFRRNYSGDSNAQLGAYKGVPLTGANWEAVGIVKRPSLNGGTQGLNGIAVRQDDGKIYEFGYDPNSNSPQLSILRMTDTVTFNSTITTMVIERQEFYALRLRRTTAGYFFDWSPDFGLTWIQMATTVPNDWIPNPASVGVVMQTYGFTAPDSLIVPYWDLKYT